MPNRIGMNVRITSTSDGQRTVLNIAGRLESADISELDKEILSEIGSLVLDLSELQSADETGILKLGELAEGGAEFRGVSPYLQMLLDDQST